MKVDLQYQAQGGEQYVTIGNFNDTNYIDTISVVGGGQNFSYQASYYYLDDIWLSHCDSLPESLVSGLNQPFLQQQLKVYPNPFKEQINVAYSGNQTLVYSLFNSLGHEVEVQVQQQGNRHQISTGDLPKGLYWLRVSDGKREETIKLVKR